MLFFMDWYWSISPIFFRVTSLALGQCCHLHSASEVIIKDMGKSDFNLQVSGQPWCICYECLGRKLTVMSTWASSNWCMFQVQLLVSNNLTQKQMVFNGLIIHYSTQMACISYQNICIDIDPLSLQWQHNERHGISNHRHLSCLLNRLFRVRSKETSKLGVTGLCEGNTLGTGDFPAQRASNVENVSIWWHHHVKHVLSVLQYQTGTLAQRLHRFKLE